MLIKIKGYYETADHKRIIVWPDGSLQDASTLPCGVELRPLENLGCLHRPRESKKCKGHCPKCGSDNVNEEEEGCNLGCHCNDCECCYTEYYTVAYSETIWND